jgi:hypothetical protein
MAADRLKDKSLFSLRNFFTKEIKFCLKFLLTLTVVPVQPASIVNISAMLLA